MIVVKLIGGLGNQLFQYALGRHLAEKHQTPVKLDISAFNSQQLRSYALTAFNIHAPLASDDEINNILGAPPGIGKRFTAKLLKRDLTDYWPTYVKEKKFSFNPEILKLPNDIYLDGYWQSEKYFEDISSILRKEFTLNAEQSAENEKTQSHILSSESVSVHARRCDFVSDESVNRIHGICDLNYYVKAFDYIKGIVQNPRFFIFSDDIPWCRSNLDFEHQLTFVDHNGADNSHDDLQLMKQCKHHIIANSSFSWWSAWLNSNPDKLVIAPQRWVNSDYYDTKDLIPDNWIKLNIESA